MAAPYLSRAFYLLSASLTTRLNTYFRPFLTLDQPPDASPHESLNPLDSMVHIELGAGLRKAVTVKKRAYLTMSPRRYQTREMGQRSSWVIR
jgi:hypothetical protein